MFRSTHFCENRNTLCFSPEEKSAAGLMKLTVTVTSRERMYVCLVVRDPVGPSSIPRFFSSVYLYCFSSFKKVWVFSFFSFVLCVRHFYFPSFSFIHLFSFRSVLAFPPPVFCSFIPHALIASHCHNQAPGAMFGSPPPSEHAQWRRVSPHPLAPSANCLPLLRPVC